MNLEITKSLLHSTSKPMNVSVFLNTLRHRELSHFKRQLYRAQAILGSNYEEVFLILSHNLP